MTHILSRLICVHCVPNPFVDTFFANNNVELTENGKFGFQTLQISPQQEEMIILHTLCSVETIITVS